MTSYLLQDILDGDLKVFYHLVYEYEKGVRPFVLYTMDSRYLPFAIRKLEAYHIHYFIQEVANSTAINLFFGHDSCVKVMQGILEEKTLDTLTPEEDFILGALLGYDLPRQCTRYCKRKECQKGKEATTASAKEVI